MSKFRPAKVAALPSGGNQTLLFSNPGCAQNLHEKMGFPGKINSPKTGYLQYDLENLRKFIKQVYVEKAYAAVDAFARGRTDECGCFSVDRIYLDDNFDASRGSFSSYKDSSSNLNKFKRFPSYVSNKIDGTNSHGWYDMVRDGPRPFSNYSEDDSFERIKSFSSYAEKTGLDQAGENPTGFLNWDGRDDMAQPSNNSCGFIEEIPQIQSFQGNGYGSGLSQGINYIGFGDAGLFNGYCNLNSQSGVSVGGFALHGHHKQCLLDGKGDELHISKSTFFAYSESLTGFPSHQCVSVSATRHYVQGIGAESALNNGWATFDLPPPFSNNSSLNNGPAHIYGSKEPINGKTESISNPTFCAREGSVNLESDNQGSNSSLSGPSAAHQSLSPLNRYYFSKIIEPVESQLYTSEWEADFASMPEYRNQDEVSVSSIDPPQKSRNQFDSPEDYVPVPIDFPSARLISILISSPNSLPRSIFGDY
ncbi:hypothetical protein AMTR_s00046p00222600 [Amborella trichopoda]|uniref:Uncharacterized protein n=1 Tax=Amborella trichopoda TaxID=13333 RepID=U5D9I9_AMBTC|nr:hypothetical protein AMTR_s00046p00222600 [Amborella trichopoda]